ncbi:hypothetical protein [Photobacterium sp. TLY01]|uniref:hypothetical protein n=1 Tax=Photobacterium sp. TLY01 TaxID=2907534 RepID=UPI001F1EAA61|nr:hypothetical protein [Photobacterium sp. TLY01]UIP30527.1 hypothetical protein LN341_17595 [Photobacterium sp. TLY01]
MIAFQQPYPSRRKYYIMLMTIISNFIIFFVILTAESFDFIKTITNVFTWEIFGWITFLSLTIGKITLFPRFRHHYILSRYGLITESHVHSSKTGNAILRQLLAVAAVGSLAAVFIIGPSALVGFAGLGVTWLVLSGTNLDKYMLSQRVSKHEDIFFLREHNDYDEPRDYFLIYHRGYIFEESEESVIKLEQYNVTSTDIYCLQADKQRIMNKFNDFFPYGKIPSDKKDLFKGAARYLPPQEIMDIETQTSPYRDDVERCN